jgi:hypothetical protein
MSEKRPPIFPAEWLASGSVHKAEWPEDCLSLKKTAGFWAVDMLDEAAEILSKPSMPLAKIERLKAQAAAEYAPPFTVEEIKRVCPGLYGPVEH